MTGLDKIIEKIRSESQQRCDEAIANAEKNARQIEQKAEEQIEAERETADAASDEAAKAVVYHALASVEQQKKQAILKAKIQAINSAIDAAQEALLSLTPAKYFAAMLSLAKANAQGGEGIIKFNQKDLKRLPAGFLKQLAAQLPEIKLSDEPADIENGFIMVYGDIEINCTIDALIYEKRDELMELVNSIVF